MGDSGYSASELRKRYHKGGEVPDSELTASQLRARYGIQSNTRGEYNRKASLTSLSLAARK